MRAAIVSDRLNRRKIDLIPEPEWVDPPKARIDELLTAVESRLSAAGVDGLTVVAALAEAAARDAGLGDPRVTSDVKHVEIGLTDKSDSAHWLFEQLARLGIGPHAVLLGGDEFGPIGGLSGSDSLMLIPEAEPATAFSVGVEPGGLPGGCPCSRWRAGRIPRPARGSARPSDEGGAAIPDPTPGWTIEVDGFDPANRASEGGRPHACGWMYRDDRGSALRPFICAPSRARERCL